MQNVELSTANIEYAYKNDAWLGFGYLQGRQIALEAGRVDTVAAADAAALSIANRAGLTGEEFFAWLNSKNGRWFADSMFGNFGRNAELYAPGQPQR